MTPINSGWDESFQCQIVRVISRNATSRHISSLQSVDENHVTRTELGDASKKSWPGRDSNLDLHFAGSGYWPEAVSVVIVFSKAIVDVSGWFRAVLPNYDDSDKRVGRNFTYSEWTRIDSIGT